MTQEEFRAVAYRLGHRFARKLLSRGRRPDSIRLAMERAQEHLLALRAYSPELDAMKRSGVDEALAGKPIDPRYARPGAPHAGPRRPPPD
jgi:hypothetical protein